MTKALVLLAAESAVRFGPGVLLAVSGIPTNVGPVQVRWSTRHKDEGFEAPIPRELLVEVAGDAPTVDNAAAEFTDAGRVLTPYLAFAANAAIEDPEFVLAYERDAESRRGFIQALRAEQTGWFKTSRLLDTNVAGLTVQGIFAHREHDRLHRAIVHYNEALKLWRPGSELRTVMYLWFAVEALTKAALRNELVTINGTEQADLARSWAIDIRQLDAEVRRRIIFHGDTSCYSEMRTISDGAEHSFESFGELHPRAQRVRDTAIDHLRRAIIEVAQLDTDLARSLVSATIAIPLEAYPLTRVIRGTLIGGDASGLAADGYPHPWVDWTSELMSVRDNGTGGYEIRPRDTTTFRLGPGIQLVNPHFEIRGPAALMPTLRRGDITLHRAAGGDPISLFVSGEMPSPGPDQPRDGEEPHP